MKLTTEVKNYIIITFSKDKHWITEKQYEVISKCDGGKIINLGHTTINTSNIASIMTEAEYHNQFPKERPQHDNFTCKDVSRIPGLEDNKIAPEDFIPFQIKRLKNALVIWKRQIDNHEVIIQTGGLQKLITLAEKKLEALENGVEDDGDFFKRLSGNLSM